jgi:bifunctional enzyme CysN/CysC
LARVVLFWVAQSFVWCLITHSALRPELASGQVLDQHHHMVMVQNTQERRLTAALKVTRNGHKGAVVWLTGLSGAGKSTLAAAVEFELFNQGKQVFMLDGDHLRGGLCSDLGFSPEDRKENVRRAGEVAALFAQAGVLCIAAFISPYRSERALARRVAPEGRFLEVYLNAPLSVCEKRDPKGLYARARTGELKQFTGISAPYEPPERPDLELRTDQFSVAQCVDLVLDKIKRFSS